MPLDVHQLKQLKQLDQRALSGQMTSEDRPLLRALIESYGQLVDLLKDPDTTRDDLSPFVESYEQYLEAEDVNSERSGALWENRDQ
jgi:hypothetical protein